MTDTKKIKTLTIRNKSQRSVSLCLGVGIRTVEPGATIVLYEPVARSYLAGQPDIWELADDVTVKPDDPKPPDKPEGTETKPAPAMEKPKKSNKKGRTK